ncbi:MAG TPA: glycosyltransferase family 4 protein [Nitrospira sp.]|nr:glycosyltransferase family 4 protein [Nitrospira sp.]HNI67058.1 glycosyltransferase family 4 protein [Nitrospira sp.]HNL88212.1 glycosyltransferase family 4 protein [Nitrospira sp.]
MRILLLTMYFDPEPTPKGLAFARELTRNGFEVEVATGFPNHPGGRLYPGYQMKLIQREVVDGVQITRLPIYPSHDSSVIRRVTTYTSIAWSILIYGLFFAKRPDAIYVFHPPLTIGVVAALLRMVRRVPIVYDIQDMWPDTLRAVGMVPNERVLAIVAGVCNWVYRRVDRIVVLCPGFKKLLIDRGVPSDKVDVIYNWCDEDVLASENTDLPSSFPSSDFFRVLFAGNMGKAQALEAVLKAAKMVEVSHPRVRFIFLGSGVELPHLRALCESMGVGNVVFMPRIPMTDVGAVLRSADVLLVHLKDDPLFAITVPSKTQAYMNTGRPIIMGVRGDAADLVEDAACGMVAVPESAESIAGAVDRLSRMSSEERTAMGQRGKAYYEKQLSLKIGCKAFARVFRGLASPASR